MVAADESREAAARRFANGDPVDDDEQMPPAQGKRAMTQRNTRRAIRRAAMELFLAKSYDAVTTTEVAEAAGVSPATLFNYFNTKEDLFFGQIHELEVKLGDLVRSCPPGESILDRLRSHVLFELTAGRNETRPADVGPFHHQVAMSARLQAREHEMYDQRERVLSEAIAGMIPADAKPLTARVAARMYVAAEKLIAAELREQFTRVDASVALRDIEPFIDQVFAVLTSGLGALPSTGSRM